MLGSSIIFFTALFSVLSILMNGNIDPGTVGLSMTYALQVTQTLNWTVRQYCEIETNIVSVERVVEYCKLKSEAPEIIEDEQLDESWPAEGRVQFKDYSTRYIQDGPYALEELDFEVKPREKLGIVGRTGAGKSSLTLSLFRIIEAAQGSIIIDGVDISKIGLRNLRSRLTIIPQDPFLFNGSIRLNIDPLERHDDADIWTALENAHLKAFIETLDGKLEAKVEEDGSNFSVGQKQLLCLARALLRKPRVLVMDEATSGIDEETDRLIQDTIRREFDNCTVITIAHRIKTIFDYDRIIVLAQGHIREYDTPKALLMNPESLFASLCKEAGLH